MTPQPIPADFLQEVVDTLIREHNLRYAVYIACRDDDGYFTFDLRQTEDIFRYVNDVVQRYVVAHVHPNHEVYDTLASSAGSKLTIHQAAACGLLLARTVPHTSDDGWRHGTDNPNWNWQIRLFGPGPTKRALAFPYVMAEVLRRLGVDCQVEQIVNDMLARESDSNGNTWSYSYRTVAGEIVSYPRADTRSVLRTQVLRRVIHELRRHVEVKLPSFGDSSLYHCYADGVRFVDDNEQFPDVVDQTLYEQVAPKARLNAENAVATSKDLVWAVRELLADGAPSIAGILNGSHSRRLLDLTVHNLCHRRDTLGG